MSHALTDAQLLTIWERGLTLGPTERAMLVLQATDTSTCEDLRALPLGRRDARLLEVREATFGLPARLRTGCPHCRAEVEFEVAAGDLHRGQPLEAGVSLELDDMIIEARAPHSDDLLAAELASSADDAAEQLWNRCVWATARDGSHVAASRLNGEQRARIESALDAMDPQVDVAFTLSCAACGAGWVAPCDVARLLWDEVAGAARGLFEQIGVLARGFGWTEEQILRLTRRRRAMYQEMLQ
jgi:hypothetical protein